VNLEKEEDSRLTNLITVCLKFVVLHEDEAEKPQIVFVAAKRRFPEINAVE
jgi:hypothetical protein